ncbi:MAG TPA: tetratricopeptide repeat protein [Pirellulales bacterium]|jgi:tetratricopeptide (TPR) repeat protein
MTTPSPKPGEPVDFGALFAEAHRQHSAGRLAEAAAVYRELLALRPDVAEVHNNLGAVLRNLGQADEALAHCEQALALRPDYAEAHYNLGAVLRDRGKLDQAAARYQQALALRPDYADAHYNLGVTFAQQGKLEQAAARFEHAIALRPNHPDSYYNLGVVLRGQGKLQPAVACYEQALALKPNYAEAHNNLGTLIRDQGKLDQAAAHFEQAIALKPTFVQAYNNLGIVLREQGDLDQAAARYRQALALRPDFAEAHNNLGTTLWDLGALDEATASYQQALALKPDFAEAEFSLATCYLSQGDFQLGWPAYEARLRFAGAAMPRDLPRWTDQPLPGRSLLLVAEQGLGDTIQFMRYARVLKRRGARIVLAVQKALGRLLANHPDVDELFMLGSASEFPRCDFYLPLLSAPGALGTTAATIPSDVPYLAADPMLTDQWRAELAVTGGFNIGIAWQGSRDYPSDRWRSTALRNFAPLARLPGVRLISLQKGLGSEQAATIDFPLLDLSGRLDGVAGAFMDTAAVIRNLDLLVTPDTVIAHLAGALGAPVWVALPLAPDWRWPRAGDESPWYPTMRLFRQTTLAGWPEVISRIADAIQAHRAEAR